MISRLENLSSKNKYILCGIMLLTFILLEFGLGPKVLFGLTEPIQYLTNRYFRIKTSTFDYALIASFVAFAAGIAINQEKTDLKNIFSNYFKISIACCVSFTLGLVYLYYFQKPENLFIPEHIIIEPFNSYSMLLIGTGILFTILIHKPKKSNEVIDQKGNSESVSL